MRYFIGAVIILFTLGFNGKALAQNDPPSERELDPPSAKYAGFEVSYTEMVQQVKKFDSTLVFKTTGKENGLPIHVASGINRSHVEIVGMDNNIRRIAYVVHLVSGDAEGNWAAMTRVGTTFGAVAHALPGSLQWMLKEVNTIRAAPTVSFKHTTTEFRNYQVTVEFDATENTIKLTMVV